jgi:hypothetical protein
MAPLLPVVDGPLPPGRTNASSSHQPQAAPLPSIGSLFPRGQQVATRTKQSRPCPRSPLREVFRLPDPDPDPAFSRSTSLVHHRLGMARMAPEEPRAVMTTHLPRPALTMRAPVARATPKSPSIGLVPACSRSWGMAVAVPRGRGRRMNMIFPKLISDEQSTTARQLFQTAGHRPKSLRVLAAPPQGGSLLGSPLSFPTFANNPTTMLAGVSSGQAPTRGRRHRTTWRRSSNHSSRARHRRRCTRTSVLHRQTP